MVLLLEKLIVHATELATEVLLLEKGGAMEMVIVCDSHSLFKAVTDGVSVAMGVGERDDGFETRELAEPSDKRS